MNLNLPHNTDNNFEQCMKCTICTVYCPVAAVNPLYPGPKQAGPDGERLRLKSKAYYDEALKYCLNCKRCEVACPSDVRIGDLIQAARIKHSSARPKLRDIILANTDLVGSVSATPLAPIINTFLSLKPSKFVMDKTLGIDHRRMFPEYSGMTFEKWYRKHAGNQYIYTDHVAYFHGCYVNYNNPQLGRDLIKVFNSLDIGVHLLDKEKCCGVALMSNGLIDQAKKQANTNIDAIRRSAIGNNMPVVTTSSTCTFTMRDEYPHLLGIENTDVRDSIHLATRYLYMMLSEGSRRLRFSDRKIKIAYHTACHMERMGWSCYSIGLLKMIPGVELTVLDSQCCGIAGTYGFKKENYRTSQAIGQTLFDKIERGNYDMVVTDCETCKWQIEMSTSKKCENPISVLASAIK